jgi:hypothetical protein
VITGSGLKDPDTAKATFEYGEIAVPPRLDAIEGALSN